MVELAVVVGISKYHSGLVKRAAGWIVFQVSLMRKKPKMSSVFCNLYLINVLFVCVMGEKLH